MDTGVSIVNDVFLAFTLLIGSEILEQNTLADSLVILLFFSIYYIGEALYIGTYMNAPAAHIWRTLGHMATFLLTQDIILRLEESVANIPTLGRVISALIIVILALRLYRFEPLQSVHIMRTVIYTLAFYYSGRLLRLTTQPTHAILNTHAVFLLTLAIVYLVWEHRSSEPSQNIYRVLFVQISVFFVVRWLVHIYRDQFLHLNTSDFLATMLNAISQVLLLMLFIQHVFRVVSSTVRDILEAFVFFLLLALVQEFGRQRRSLIPFLSAAFVTWYILTTIQKQIIPRLLSGTDDNGDREWLDWISYLFAFIVRVASYLTIQVLIVYANVNFNTEHTLRKIDRVVSYFILLLFVSHFLWRDKDAAVTAASKLKPKSKPRL